jgi:hypothetical protein
MTSWLLWSKRIETKGRHSMKLSRFYRHLSPICISIRRGAPRSRGRSIRHKRRRQTLRSPRRGIEIDRCRRQTCAPHIFKRLRLPRFSLNPTSRDPAHFVSAVDTRCSTHRIEALKGRCGNAVARFLKTSRSCLRTAFSALGRSDQPRGGKLRRI